MKASSSWHMPKFQTPRRKAGVQHKPRCLYNPFRGTDSLLLVSVIGILPKSKFSATSQGPTLQASLKIKLEACCRGRSGRDSEDKLPGSLPFSGSMNATLKDHGAATGSAVPGNDSAGEPGVSSPIAAELQE